MKSLVIATRNAHKAGEIRAILGAGFRCLTLNELPDAPRTVEDANSFAGNATKKAVELARFLSRSEARNLPLDAQPMLVLADDSGLEVDALKGAPGVHSARFAALDLGRVGNSSDAENNDKLLRLLKDIPAGKRTARFRCVVALVEVARESSNAGAASPVCDSDEFEWRTEIFQGVCEGRIRFSPSGEGGFGYDPLFVPDGFEQTFAELGEETKNRISHRSKALAVLQRKLAPAG